jgi:hypothetical protein
MKNPQGKHLRLVQYCVERLPREQLNDIPSGLGLRGIYVLFNKKEGERFYNVVYIGISTVSIKSRLAEHSKHYKKDWTHFSFYKVWPNITDGEIKELEGLFLRIYKKDSQAQKYNLIKGFGPLSKVKIKNLRNQKENLKDYERKIRHFPK